MSGDTRSYALNISEHLFRLTTESLRLHSNETGRYQTLASLVNARAAACLSPDDHNPETIRKHFGAIPTKGDIKIYLSISMTSAKHLSEAKRRLGQHIGSSMTVGDALSLLLFDYVVEQKATRVLQRLGLDDVVGGKDETVEDGSQPRSN
jgi:hypothetical protein